MNYIDILIQNIIFLRKYHKLTQEQLSQKLDMGTASKTISKWENYGATPDIEHLHRLAEIFNVSMNDLVDKLIEEELSNGGMSLSAIQQATKKSKEDIIYPVLDSDDSFVFDPNNDWAEKFLDFYNGIKFTEATLEENNIVTHSQVLDLKYYLVTRAPFLKGMCSYLISQLLQKENLSKDDYNRLAELIPLLKVDDEQYPIYLVEEKPTDEDSYLHPEVYDYYNDGDGNGYIVANALYDYYECLTRLLNILPTIKYAKNNPISDMLALALAGNKYARSYLIEILDLRDKTVTQAKEALSKEGTWEKEFLDYLLQAREQVLSSLRIWVEPHEATETEESKQISAKCDTFIKQGPLFFSYYDFEDAVDQTAKTTEPKKAQRKENSRFSGFGFKP